MNKLFRKRIIFSIISIILLVIVVLTRTYAWYIHYAGIRTDSDDIKLSSIGKYYDSGIGTKEDPFVITKARHLYNLAWLQDLGYYDEDIDSDPSLSGIQPFYFKLGANIDMSDLSKNGVISPIPAIGIDSYPFVSNFDGNGYRIDNLYISTEFANSNYIKPSKNVLDNHEETIENSSILTKYMGLFGYIGSLDYGKELDTTVSNFTISNETVEVSKDSLIGYICGYADNDISNIGVANSNFDIKNNVSPISVNVNGANKEYEYLSLYSLIGDYDSYNSGLSWINRPTGGEFGYGGSLDMKKLYETVGSTGVPTNAAYPIKAVSMDIVKPSNGSITVNNYDGNNSKVVTLATTQQAGSNNIGYFVGESTKMYAKSSSKYNLEKYYYPINSTDDVELPYKDSNGVVHNYPSEDIVKYIKDNFSSYLYGARLNNDADLNNVIAVESGVASGYEGTIILPSRTIWVAPVEVGTIRFVVYNTDNENRSFSFKRIQRRIAGNFGTGFASTSTTTIITADGNGGLKQNKLYYYEYEVTEDDLKNGYEYVITKGNGNNGCYFLYIDLGTEGSSSSNIGTINNVDFTYVDESTRSGYKNVSVDDGFILSKVGFTLKNSSISEVFLSVYRSILNGNEVFYYFSGSGIELIPMGSPIKKSSKDELKD